MSKAFFIKGCVFAMFLAGLAALASFAQDEVAAVNAIRLDMNDGTTRFVIEKKGAVEYQDFTLNNPPRLVIDFIGARHNLESREFDGDGKLVAKVRTSQFTNTPEEITRVVFDLKGSSKHEIKDKGDRLVIEFFPQDRQTAPVLAASASAGMPGTVPGWSAVKKVKQAAEEHKRTVDAASQAAATPVAATTTATTTTTTTKPAATSRPLDTPKPTAVRESAGDNRIASAWRQASGRELTARPYPMDDMMQGGMMGASKNKKITIDVQNADIKTVLESFAEFAGVNIIAGPEVQGEVTAHIKNVPWRQALDILLKSHGYGSEEQYGVIRVSTIDQLTKEELERQAADRKKDDLLPLVTRIIPLAFAKAEEMKKALDKIVSQRGNIQVEEGSNALVVTDIEKNVDKVERMAKSLDTKLKQVEIVAKMVDVDANATKDLGIRWDFLNLAPANVGVVGDGVIDVQSPAPAGTFRIGTVRSWGELRAVIDMLEQTNKANIISNPRIVTADNREASILVGKEIPLIVSDEAGNPITELTKVGIGLRVTPHVNLDGTITLDLHPEVSELSSQATVQGGVIISMSEADTRVVVNDGETAVIGGLISKVESSLERGIPILKDVPFIGNLFKYKNTTKKNRELIIFITPRIVESFSDQSS
jgi:type IV pilus assembly protein PilQ